MNKTVSINLGGFFFHIDEDAYQKLNRYFDAIKRSLSPDAKDEIMADIEGRIAELLSEKISNDKQVVGIKEIDDIIAVMGQPEDYRIDEDTEPKAESKKTFNSTYYAPKKLYRDADKKLLAGVCAGIGHYFRIDPLWVRILFIISPFITFGTSVFIYVLLWILVPKALTTSEKLQMQGEPINISNIEKKVRAEYTILQEKLQSVDYDKIGNNVKSGAEKIGSGISAVVLGILKVFAKIIGAFITVFSALGLGAAFVFLILLLFTSNLSDQAWYPYIDGWNFTNTPLWLLALVSFFTVAIPLFAFFNLGLRILVDTMKPVSNLVTYTFLGVWIVCLSASIYLGLYELSQLGTEGRTFVKSEFALKKGDTLNVIFKNNEYFTKYNDYDESMVIKQDSAGREVLYSNNIRLYIRHTDEAQPYVQVEKIAQGHSMQEASKFAQNIKYNFKVSGNSLILENYLLTVLHDKFRIQRVEVFLYLPEGTYFKADGNVQKYDATDNDFFNLQFDDEDRHIYKMMKSKVECLTCPPEGIPAPPDFEAPIDVEADIQTDEAARQRMEQADNLEMQAEELKRSAEDLKESAKEMQRNAKDLRKQEN